MFPVFERKREMCFHGMKAEMRLEAGSRLTLKYSGRLGLKIGFNMCQGTRQASHCECMTSFYNQCVWRMNE